MATSPLIKIFIGLILIFVICIPEWFNTIDGNEVYLSCINACFEESPYLPTDVTKSIICITQGNNTKDIQRTLQNNTVYTVNLSISINNSTLLCEHQRHKSSSFQYEKIPEKTSNFSIEVSGKYVIYSKDSHFTLVNVEDRNSSLPFSFEIHIKNTTGPNGTNDGNDDGNFQNTARKSYGDLINISLQLNRHIPYYKGTLGIIWLSSILLVFVCGVIFVVFKVLEEKSSVKTIYKESATLKRYRYQQNISPKTHCLEDHQKCGGQKHVSSHSSPALPVIAEHPEKAS